MATKRITTNKVLTSGQQRVIVEKLKCEVFSKEEDEDVKRKMGFLDSFLDYLINEVNNSNQNTMATKKELEERICRLEAKIFYMEKDLAGVKYQVEGEEGVEEPNYLQVGDQWRDEEGNEYVLSMIDVEEDEDEGTTTQYFFLVNKQTGDTVGRIVDIHKMTYFYDCSRVRLHLGITDSMTKIK